MTDAVVPSRSPFAGVSTRDLVRDVVAAVALLVALPLPWGLLHRGSDLLWVVLTTVLALLVVAAPYARRAGVLSAGWARLAEPGPRLLGLAPYALVALLYLVLDVFAVSDNRIGAGLALGLAGVALAAALPTDRGVAVSGAVVALAAVATPLVTVIEGASWPVVVGSVLAALLVLGVLWLTVWSFLHGDEAAGVVLVAVGGAICLELALLGGGTQHPWFESLHGVRYGMLLLPLVAAFAVPAVVGRAAASAGEPADVSAARWVRVAVRALELMIVVAAFVALVAIVRLAAVASDLDGFGFAVEPVIRLVIGVLVVVVAFLARRSLVRDPRAGHATAVGAACVIVVLGLVILVARAGIGTATRVEELLLALALPAIVLGALLAPPSVRALVGADENTDRVDSTSSAAQAGGAAAGVMSAPVHVADVAPVQQQSGHQERSAASTSSASGGPGSRWRGTWADGTDATQQMAPVQTPARGTATRGQQTQQQEPVAQRPAPAQNQPQQQFQAPADTQVMQPVTGAPGAGWTPERALDPTTPLADLAQIVQEAPHLRPHVAANPSTYPALLDWLGALGDPSVDAALRTRR